MIYKNSERITKKQKVNFKAHAQCAEEYENSLKRPKIDISCLLNNLGRKIFVQDMNL